MILLKSFLCLFLFFNINLVNSEDVFATINTLRSLNIVDEKFISFVIDPMILLSGLNISTTTLNLARHLSPAFVRLSGPSTPSFIFSGDGVLETAERLTVTTDMWISLNEWIAAANLTAVFALSDRERVNEVWNARMVLPLMELTDKMNLNCYWELENDCNKTMKEYLSDLDALLHIQDAFPRSKDKWITVAGEMSKSLTSSDYESVKKLVHSLIGKVKAINWNPVVKDGHDLNSVTKYIMTTKPKIPLWTNAPRTPQPTSFTNGLHWAKYLGDSAKLGYDVVFRQPKIREFFEVTPAYWISYLHKTLMGRSVLDIRASNAYSHSETYMYAHCARRQASERGAAVLFMVNMQENAVNSSVRFMSASVKKVQIQSYVLTSPDENTSTVFLNGELLDTELSEGSFKLSPKISGVNVGTYLTVALPPKSVSFFVIPSVKLHVCTHDDELNKLNLIKSIKYQKDPRKTEEIKEAKRMENLANMNDLYKMMEEELESNERYYKNELKRKEWRDILVQKAKEEKTKVQPIIQQLINEDKKVIINKDKLKEKQNKFLVQELKLKDELKDKQLENMQSINMGTPEEENKKIVETNDDLAQLLGEPLTNLEVEIGDPNTRQKRGLQDTINKLKTKGKHAINIVYKQKNSLESSESEQSYLSYYDIVHGSSKQHSRETEEIGEKEASREYHYKPKNYYILKLEKIEPGFEDSSEETFIESCESAEQNYNRAKRDIKTDLGDKLREKTLKLKTRMLERKAILENKLKARKAQAQELVDKDLNRIKRAVINVEEKNSDNNTLVDEPNILVPSSAETQNARNEETKEALKNLLKSGDYSINITSDETLTKLLNVPIVLVVGKPVDLNKIVIDEKKKERQIKLLKSRLAKKKKLEERKNKYLQHQEHVMNKLKKYDEILAIKKRSIGNNIKNLDNNKYNNLLTINEIRKDNLDDSNNFNLLFNEIKKNNEKLRDDEFDILQAVQKSDFNKNNEKSVTMLNDIIKDGKFISNFLNDVDDDIYKLLIEKPGDMKKASESKLFEVKKMNDKKLDNLAENLQKKINDAFIDLNVYNTMNKEYLKTETSTESSTQTTLVTDGDKELASNIHEDTLGDKEFEPKFTMVNDLFDSLANMLGNLHSKVVNYAVYLTQ